MPAGFAASCDQAKNKKILEDISLLLSDIWWHSTTTGDMSSFCGIHLSLMDYAQATFSFGHTGHQPGDPILRSSNQKHIYEMHKAYSFT
jgi:hypothetical protein